MDRTFPEPELLSHREWVRRLAARLVADPATADDLAQETLRISLETPPPREAGRAWLATVLRNLLRRRARGDGRRRSRETAAARPEAVPAAADVAARAESHRRVVEAVMALEEPYRSTVLLRFFDDLPPREVAARTGVPVETVRTRLRRALERLRAALTAGNGDGGGAWLSALAAGEGMGTGGRGAAGPGVAAATGGGIVATATAKVVTAAVVVAAAAGTGVWWVAGGDEAGPAKPAVVEMADVPAEGSGDDRKDAPGDPAIPDAAGDPGTASGNGAGESTPPEVPSESVSPLDAVVKEIRGRDERVTDFLARLGAEHRFVVRYRGAELEARLRAQSITVTLRNTPVRKALTVVTHMYGADWSEEAGGVVIHEPEATPPPDPKAGEPTEADRKLLAFLKETRTTATFDGQDLGTVLRYFAQRHKFNVVSDPEKVGDRMRRARVNQSFVDQPLDRVLDELMQLDATLRWKCDQGLIRILENDAR